MRIRKARIVRIISSRVLILFKKICLLFLILTVGACFNSNEDKSSDKEKDIALEELKDRNISFDLKGLKTSTYKENSDGAYIFENAGYFQIISDSDFKELVKHAGKRNNQGLISILLSLDKDLNIQSRELSYHVNRAIKKGKTRTLKLLIKYGGAPDSGSLSKSIYSDNFSLVKLVIKLKPDFSDGEYKDALFLAARIGHLESMRAIVDSNMAPRIAIENSIMGAALNEKIDVIKYLIAQGVDVNYRAKDGCTSLHFLAQDGTIEMIRYMITAGANINAECRKGETPLKWAYYGKNEKVIAYLEDNNALIN